MSYKVTAPLVIIPNADGTSGDWYGYQSAVVPDGLNDERCKQLAVEGLLAVEEEPSIREPSIKEILAEVGDDKDKATAALEQEQAGKNRSTLVGKLEAVIAAASKNS